MIKITLLCAAILCAIAVMLGAFGAHALKSKLSLDMLAVYQTAVQYHFIHALGLFAIAFVSLHLGQSPLLTASSVLMVVGIIIFSGSLYILSITGIKWLGAITPIGGLSFIIAWLLLASAIFKS